MRWKACEKWIGLWIEFVRLQLIVGEDLTKSLMALCTDLEASCVALVSDIARTMDLHLDDPTSHQVKAALWKFQQTTSLKVTLPLMELEAAHDGGIHVELPPRTKLPN